MDRDTLSGIERRRLRLQTAIDGERSQGERNRSGQFATPPELATMIVKQARKLWPGSLGKVRFCDPALGTGAFYAALLRVFPKSLIASASGIELDCDLAKAADSLWQKTGLRVVVGDFPTTVMSGSVERPNLVVTNPPYVRHHHLSPDKKAALQQMVCEKTGFKLSGLTGFYVYYLILATEWMEDAGLGIWLIPSEFMDVNYGAALRRYLCERVTLLRIHRFDEADVQFTDALVSSAALYFRKGHPSDSHKVKFTWSGTIDRPRTVERVSVAELREGVKWSLFPRVGSDATSPSVSPRVLRFGDLFRVRRGIATGANHVFILPKRECIDRGFSRKFLKAILPSPRKLTDLIIDADDEGYPAIPEQLALIDCDLPEDELAVACRSLWEYLKSFESKGIAQRYLLRRRTPWYRQEQRPVAPFLCTYMGRTGSRKKAFRLIWNRSQAIATNTYLMLYPKPTLSTVIRESVGKQNEVFQLLQLISAEALHSEGRSYGGGLKKIEPKELENVDASCFLPLLPKVEVQRGFWRD